MDILRVENVKKTYGRGEAAVHALNDVSFSVQKGDFVAIVGSSGSGKSTLLHIIGGVDRPTSGRVFVEDTDIYALDESKLAIFRRRQVGLIYQFYNLIPVLDVEENITLPLLLDAREVDQKQTERYIRHARPARPQKTPAKPAFRRAAAARIHRPRADQQPGADPCGRADR